MRLQDIYDDLITTNEIGDGSRDYELEDGVLYANLYEDADDGQKLTGRVRIGIELKLVEAGS
jgi:hypothetical protein